MRIKKVNSDAIKLYETSQVKFKVAGNTREVQFTTGNNTFCPIQNISKDKYLDKETGEIKERKKSVSRYQTPKSVRKSINRLMDLIRCNATEPTHCKWLTLTYADAMTDHTKVYEDGKMFLRRFQRYLNKSEEFLTVRKPSNVLLLPSHRAKFMVILGTCIFYLFLMNQHHLLRMR